MEYILEEDVNNYSEIKHLTTITQQQKINNLQYPKHCDFLYNIFFKLYQS